MSINNLFDSGIIIPAILVVFVIVTLAAIPSGLAKGKKTNEEIYGVNNSEAEEVLKAKIIAKRNYPHPLSKTVTINAALFETANGNRIELAIKDPDIFSVMVEGDCGILSYQGKKFVSFERENGNEK